MQMLNACTAFAGLQFALNKHHKKPIAACLKSVF